MRKLWMVIPLVLVSCAPTAPEAPPPRVVTTETGEELVAPRVIRRADPAYPQDLRRQGVEGSVVLSAQIGVDGVPREIEVVRSSHPALNQLAVESLRKWRFAPGTRDGVAVPVIFRVTVDFNLN